MSNDEVVSLRQYIEALMNQERKSHAREHELLAESVQHTKENLELRLESMNQFRSQITEERGTMLSRETYETRHVDLERRISLIETGLANIRGRSAATSAALGVGLVILQLVMHFFLR
jgi:hypothetical protein